MTATLDQLQAQLRQVSESIQAELVEVSVTVAAFTAAQKVQTRMLRQLGTRVLRLHQEYGDMRTQLLKLEHRIATLEDRRDDEGNGDKNGGAA